MPNDAPEHDKWKEQHAREIEQIRSIARKFSELAALHRKHMQEFYAREASLWTRFLNWLKG